MGGGMIGDSAAENERLEIRLLLEAVFLKYGYDFRGYSEASLKRRLRRRLELAGLESLSQMQHRILYDEPFFETLLLDLSINVTEMFRDPPFFRALRERVAPILAEAPYLKIWHAGCATGEEVYSMAILLKEAGLAERTRIYATDSNEVVLAKAREGIFPVDRLKGYTANYQRAGGRESFADYYTAGYDSVIMEPSLRERVVFSDHNLVTDGVFGEMHAIVCRNVLIYFGRDLQDRVFRLFHDSLCDGGFLCVGTKESVRYCSCAEDFEPFADRERIYRKSPVPDEGMAAVEGRAWGAEPS